MHKKPNILITGGSGFIGQHLVKLAINRGYEVYALVRKSSDTDAIKKMGATLLTVDLGTKQSITKALQQLVDMDISVNYVIHAAALTKARSEKEFTQANRNVTENLLEALNDSGIRANKLIFISSLAASGPQAFGNTIETDHAQPITLYGKSKLMAETAVKTLSSAPYIILRPTAVYGPGERDLFTVFKIISRGLNPVLGSNPQALTFIYVKDLVEFIMAALTTQEKNKTYFISDGYVYSKHALGDAISTSLNKKSLLITLPLPLVKLLAILSQYTAAVFGKQSPLNLEKYKELTAQSWNCNTVNAVQELNYMPQYGLQHGVRETTDWYKKNKWIK